MTAGAMKTACLLLPLFLTPSLAKANGKDIVLADSRSDEIRKGAVIGSKGRHLNADDSIRDLLGHPAFAGFARLLLPWDGRRYDETMRLSEIGSLLPYHSHVEFRGHHTELPIGWNAGRRRHGAHPRPPARLSRLTARPPRFPPPACLVSPPGPAGAAAGAPRKLLPSAPRFGYNRHSPYPSGSV